MQLCVVAVVHPRDEVVGAHGPRCLLYLLFGGIEAAVADVLQHRAGEEEGLLEHQSHAPGQRFSGHMTDVVAVDEDAAAGDIVEAGDQGGDGGLAGAGLADKCDRLARLHVEVEVT